MSNVVDRRQEWVQKIARNVMDLDPEVKRQIIRVYDNLTQRDIYLAMTRIKETEKNRSKR